MENPLFPERVQVQTSNRFSNPQMAFPKKMSGDVHDLTACTPPSLAVREQLLQVVPGEVGHPDGLAVRPGLDTMDAHGRTFLPGSKSSLGQSNIDPIVEMHFAHPEYKA